MSFLVSGIVSIISLNPATGGEVKGQINLRQVVKILENPLDKNKNNYIGLVTPDRTYEIIAEDENEHRSVLVAQSMLLFKPFHNYQIG